MPSYLQHFLFLLPLFCFYPSFSAPSLFSYYSSSLAFSFLILPSPVPQLTPFSPFYFSSSFILLLPPISSATPSSPFLSFLLPHPSTPAPSFLILLLQLFPLHPSISVLLSLVLPQTLSSSFFYLSSFSSHSSTSAPSFLILLPQLLPSFLIFLPELFNSFLPFPSTFAIHLLLFLLLRYSKSKHWLLLSIWINLIDLLFTHISWFLFQHCYLECSTWCEKNFFFLFLHQNWWESNRLW